MKNTPPIVLPEEGKAAQDDHPITIVIVDDHRLIRENWNIILNQSSQFKVLADFESAEEALENIQSLLPHVILLDINLPLMNGIEATPIFLKISPYSKILAVSMHSQVSYALKMMKAGASGYITKTSGREELYTAILEVHGGKKYICEEIKTALSQDMFMAGEDRRSLIQRLTSRELEIISLIKEGATSKEIAARCNVSIKTVEVHRYNILKKLNLKNAASLVNFVNNH
jgi:DNA-binding NarL/FixJ family response regulator